jgi:hypothetical protein
VEQFAPITFTPLAIAPNCQTEPSVSPQSEASVQLLDWSGAIVENLFAQCLQNSDQRLEPAGQHQRILVGELIRSKQSERILRWDFYELARYPAAVSASI